MKDSVVKGLMLISAFATIVVMVLIVGFFGALMVEFQIKGTHKFNGK